MDQQKEKNGNSVEKYIQSILLTLITAALIGGFVKVTNISDTLIIIREQALANREIINEMAKSVNRLQMNDQNKNDRITILEYQVRDLKERVDNNHPIK